MGWKWMAVGISAVALVLAAAPPAPSKKTPKPPACPGGRFPLDGDALVPGGSVPDSVSIDGVQVAVESGCAATTAKRKLTRTRTILRARWRQCTGLVGPASLVVKLDAASCETLSGRFRAPKAKIRRALAGTVEVPADAYGRASDPLPDNAVLVSGAEFDALRQRSDFRSLGKKQTADDQAALDAREAANQQTVLDFLQTNPQLADQYIGGSDPTNPNVVPADGENFAFTFTDASGAPQTVTTHGRHWRFAILADALRKFPTQENQLRLYDEFYGGLAGIDPALPGQYPSPDAVKQYGLADLIALNASLVSQVGQYLPLVPPPGGLPPAGHPATCAGEEGYGDGIDQSGPGCATHAAGGVYLNKNWPLKFFATCTKSQGARGTCWDFATTAATELWIAKKYARWVNLSEQHMNFLYKHIWYPSYYGDNGWPPDALDKIIDTGYAYPFERDWDYNQSRSRTIDNVALTYHNSCVGYGGGESAFCSDTNHQGQIFCFDFGLFRFCAAIGPSIATTSGFAPTAYAELWRGDNPDFSLGLIFWAVGIFQKPVILSLGVPGSFYPGANGYVHYVGPHCPVTTDSNGNGVCHPASGCECDGGGHSVLVTGLIDNTQLPAGAPAGAGGGYLIIKNSWGYCYGDAGYAYLPYDWVKAYAFGAEVVGDIN